MAWLFLLGLIGDLWILPQVQVERDSVVVVWQTAIPSRRATVYYEPADSTTPTRSYLPERTDFAYEVWDRKNLLSREHRLVLRDIQAGVRYRFQVRSVTEKGDVLYSRVYAFQVKSTDQGPALVPTLDLGPYLFVTAPGTLWVRIRPTRPGPFELIWEEVGRSHRLPFSQDPERTDWMRVRAPRGVPGAPVRYRVCWGKQETSCTPWYALRRVPPPGTAEPVTFAMMADDRSGYLHPESMAWVNRINVPVLGREVRLAFRRGAAFLLMPGDLVYGYTEDTVSVRLQYETFLQATEPVSAMIPLLPGMGNHDATAPMIVLDRRASVDPPPPNAAENWFARFFILPENGPEAEKGAPPYRENVYYLDWGVLRIVHVNVDYRFDRKGRKSPSSRLDERQAKWLEQVLQDARYRGRIPLVAFHEPLFPGGSHLGYSLDRHPEDRDRFLHLLQRFRVPFVFVGHEHQYVRLEIPGPRFPLVQIINGRAGSSMHRDVLEPLRIPYADWVKARSPEEGVVLLHYSPPLSFQGVFLNLAGDTVDVFHYERQ